MQLDVDFVLKLFITEDIKKKKKNLKQLKVW